MNNDYKKMYLRLFNRITDALELMEEDSKAAEMLREAQRETEEMYISLGEGD